ncbi:hypothetical protein Cni_G15173 [Canna indica]|uniref:Uncharacterized protein n=1 Tax=Canna indica TaxID=4628 RepID=A0AAQ3KE15_9LILI|nr:hypothetical protein Cni_G15173 [Canna indica]
MADLRGGFPCCSSTAGSDPFVYSYFLQARDAFYACLEKEADKEPTEIATVGLLYPAQCKAARAEYAAKCRPTWVLSLLRFPFSPRKDSSFFTVSLILFMCSMEFNR